MLFSKYCAPTCVLQEDVDQFMKQSGNGSVELVLKRFDEQYKKYKFLEANLLAKRKRYALKFDATCKI